MRQLNNCGRAGHRVGPTARLSVPVPGLGSDKETESFLTELLDVGENGNGLDGKFTQIVISNFSTYKPEIKGYIFNSRIESGMPLVHGPTLMVQLKVASFSGPLNFLVSSSFLVSYDKKPTKIFLRFFLKSIGDRNFHEIEKGECDDFFEMIDEMQETIILEVSQYYEIKRKEFKLVPYYSSVNKLCYIYFDFRVVGLPAESSRNLWKMLEDLLMKNQNNQHSGTGKSSHKKLSILDILEIASDTKEYSQSLIDLNAFFGSVGKFTSNRNSDSTDNSSSGQSVKCNNTAKYVKKFLDLLEELWKEKLPQILGDKSDPRNNFIVKLLDFQPSLKERGWSIFIRNFAGIPTLCFTYVRLPSREDKNELVEIMLYGYTLCFNADPVIRFDDILTGEPANWSQVESFLGVRTDWKVIEENYKKAIIGERQCDEHYCDSDPLFGCRLASGRLMRQFTDLLDDAFAVN